MHAKRGIRFRQSSFSAQFKIVATGPQGAQAEARHKIRKATVLELLDSIDALDCVGAREPRADRGAPSLRAHGSDRRYVRRELSSKGYAVVDPPRGERRQEP